MDSHPACRQSRAALRAGPPPGEKQTIRLTGDGTRLTFRDAEITALRFTGCAYPSGMEAITVTDAAGNPKTMAELGVTYEFEPVRCRQHWLARRPGEL